VELVEGAALDSAVDVARAADVAALRHDVAPSSSASLSASEDATPGTYADQPLESQEPVTELTLADGVALVRQVLAEATVPPRWPMYLRQMKQFLRNARPDFDERRYGSLQDLLRACQKAGLVRLERDRQGGLRAFAGAVKPYVPQGWVAPETETAADVEEATAAAVDAVVVTEGDATATSLVSADPERAQESPVQAGEVVEPAFDTPVPAPSVAGEETEADDQLAMFGVVRPTDPEPVKAKRVSTAPRRSRKTLPVGASERPKRARKPATVRTPSRRSRS
jgi:hypothetical protein